MKEIDRLIESALEKGRFHGFQVGVYRDGSALFERSYGDAPDTIYRVYSMTKPVTAAAVMTLVEKGGIDLLTPLSEILPEYAHMNRWEEDGAVPCERPILIRDLLNMTSGICYPGTEGCAAQMQLLFDEIQGKVETPKAYTTREVVRMAARVPLAFEPGTKWGYGLSADVLGAVIEEVTGMSLREYYQRTIFEPLGMEDTDFYVPQEKRGRLSELYRIGEKGLEVETKRHLGLSYGCRVPAFQSGGAGLFTTLSDYSRFARMLGGRGTFEGRRILSPGTVEFFTRDQMAWGVDTSGFFGQMRGYGYGNLMRVHTQPGNSGVFSSTGEFVWDGWTGPYFSVDLKTGLVLVTMTQVAEFGDYSLIRRLKNIVESCF